MTDRRSRVGPYARHELSSWIDRRVVDVSGNGIGVIVDIYCDATTARPTWLAIDVGGSPPTIAVTPVRGSSLLGENVELDRSAPRRGRCPAQQWSMSGPAT
jgi:PRC-barrel domain